MRELTSDNLAVRRKSLVAARELLSVPEERVKCFKAGIIPALVDCLRHEDLQVQKSAAKDFSYLVSDAAGCQKILGENAVIALLDAAVGGNIETELECFNSLLVAAKIPSIRAYFLSSFDLLLKLLKIAETSKVPAKTSSALDLIHQVLEGRYNEDAVDYLIETNAVGVCASHLGSSDRGLKYSASRVLAFLSVSDKGKESAIASKVVEPLAEMATAMDEKLQFSASSCLMALAVANTGKESINSLEVSKLRKSIHALLDSGDEFIIMNTLQIIAAAAEHSEVRATLKPFIKKLQDMKSQLPPYVSHHLAYAVRQLGFKSLPYKELVH